MNTQPSLAPLGDHASPALLSRADLGRWGEELAANFLLSRDMRILERNWRIARGELDIIFVDPARDALVACEVKTRRISSFVSGFEAISYEKKQRLRSLLLAYLTTHDYHAPEIRVDLIAVTVFHDGEWELNHVEGVA